METRTVPVIDVAAFNLKLNDTVLHPMFGMVTVNRIHTGAYVTVTFDNGICEPFEQGEPVTVVY